VILQPHSPGTQQNWKGLAFPLEKIPEVIALARQILPSEITIQIPPNLISQPALLIASIEAGARDLGGISPHDEVNPDYPHPQPQKLADTLQSAGWKLIKRLPVYPQHINSLPTHLQKAISKTLILHK
jgi:FO synthase subunit 1